MLAYGLYSAARGLPHVFGGTGLAWWATLGLVLRGVMLIFAALPVRVSMPGEASRSRWARD
jgi:hypothetical protein